MQHSQRGIGGDISQHVAHVALVLHSGTQALNQDDLLDLREAGHVVDNGVHDGGLQGRQARVVRTALDVAAAVDAAARGDDCNARRTLAVGAVRLRTGPC